PGYPPGHRDGRARLRLRRTPHLRAPPAHPPGRRDADAGQRGARGRPADPALDHRVLVITTLASTYHTANEATRTPSIISTLRTIVCGSRTTAMFPTTPASPTTPPSSPPMPTSRIGRKATMRSPIGTGGPKRYTTPATSMLGYGSNRPPRMVPSTVPAPARG